MPTPPAKVSVALHVKRAFGWNLGRVVPSERESATLLAAGVSDPAVQRYAAWRRSLLLVAAVPTSVAAALAVLDVLDGNLGEMTSLGVGMLGLCLLAAAALPAACLMGVRSWTRPGAGSRALLSAWGVAFLLPFAYALLPSRLLFHVAGIDVPTAPSLSGAAAEAARAVASAAEGTAEKLQALQQMALDFVMSGTAYLLLLPAVLSLIPGAMNGCLRIKSAFPAAQLPGWLLVCAAPAFLLLWLVVLVVANHAAQSPLLVLGVLLWAGGPILYSLRGRVFVQSQISEADAAKIARVKRIVGYLALAGIALILTFVLTRRVAGLSVVGFDREAAMSTRIDELSAGDDEVSLDDVRDAFQSSTSFVYALDLSSWRFAVDFLAKLLLITAIFADLVLRSTLSAWRNDRAFRSRAEAAAYDASAAAALVALAPPPSPTKPPA